ncbi:hypothetical protein QE152_g25120 [Popillia japonica]|uniref:Uncharacterized protein n=1 Tax=Popillia japonica TaxID=7064 RepID=A0AAW1K445_POPJA
MKRFINQEQLYEMVENLSDVEPHSASDDDDTDYEESYPESDNSVTESIQHTNGMDCHRDRHWSSNTSLQNYFIRNIIKLLLLNRYDMDVYTGKDTNVDFCDTLGEAMVKQHLLSDLQTSQSVIIDFLPQQMNTAIRMY